MGDEILQKEFRLFGTELRLRFYITGVIEVLYKKHRIAIGTNKLLTNLVFKLNDYN